MELKKVMRGRVAEPSVALPLTFCWFAPFFKFVKKNLIAPRLATRMIYDIQTRVHIISVSQSIVHEHRDIKIYCVL